MRHHVWEDRGQYHDFKDIRVWVCEQCRTRVNAGDGPPSPWNPIETIGGVVSNDCDAQKVANVLKS